MPLVYAEIPQSDRLQEIEVITELNVVRDYRYFHRKEAVQEPVVDKTQTMPDIVIRYRDSLIVIEAKFFGMMPSEDKLKTTISLQKRISHFIGEKCYQGRVLSAL